MMHPFATSLLEVFEQYADPKRAAEMSAYMKEIDAFYGIPSPHRKQIAKEVLNAHGKGVLQDWQVICSTLMKHGKR